MLGRPAVVAIFLAADVGTAAALSPLEPRAPLPGLRPPPPDAVSWDLLAKAVVLFEKTGETYRATTMIPPEIEKLDGRALKLMGFVVPAHAETPLRKFLLAEYPADCAYCRYTVSEPSRVVEVDAPRGIRVMADPIIVRGRLEVVRNDPQGRIYRLHEAQLAD